MTRVAENFRTLYVDPGEDTGWTIGRDLKLIAGGTEKMWVFADEVWYALNNPSDPSAMINSSDFLRTDADPSENLGPIERIVCEDFRIYPWKLKELKFDRVRTARLIGALTFMARLKGIPFVLQGANIKKAAVAAGAEELFWYPLRENRHQNDAIMHFTFFTNVELLGLNLPVPDSEDQASYSDDD